jgi:hypothetical protein
LWQATPIAQPRGIKSASIKEQSVEVADGAVSSYRVNMLVTFLLEG